MGAILFSPPSDRASTRASRSQEAAPRRLPTTTFHLVAVAPSLSPRHRISRQGPSCGFGSQSWRWAKSQRWPVIREWQNLMWLSALPQPSQTEGSGPPQQDTPVQETSSSFRLRTMRQTRLSQDLMAAGADLDRVFILGPATDEGGERLFDLNRDLSRLKAQMDAIGGASLIIIDPITAYLGKKDATITAMFRASWLNLHNWRSPPTPASWPSVT